MRRKWILICQAFLKTMKTIGAKKSLLGEAGTDALQSCACVLGPRRRFMTQGRKQQEK